MRRRKFQFELESVLRVRESETKTARGNLESIRKKKEAHKRKLTSLVERLNRNLHSSNSDEHRSISRLRRGNTFRVQLQDRIAKEERLLDALTRSEAEARQSLLRARTKEEAIRKLRERAYAKHLDLMAKRENAESDEAAGIQFSRNRAGNN